MKRMMIGLGIGLAGGMTLATYALTNPKTKRSTEKMIHSVVNKANDVMDEMK